MTNGLAARPALLLRRARHGEEEALTRLCLRSKAAWGYDDAFMAQVVESASLRVTPEMIAAGDVWVAARRGRVLGVAALAAKQDEIELKLLFVEPAAMRSGIGAALLTRMMAEARRLGAGRLLILADPFAAGFYERHGASLLGQAPSDAVPGRILPLYAIPIART